MPGRAAPIPLAERLRLDGALADAFTPLRRTGTSLSPARVRAAVRWERPVASRLRGLALLSRAGELATAVAAAAFVFAASLGPALPADPTAGSSAAPVAEARVRAVLPLDRQEVFVRWLRIGGTPSERDWAEALLAAGRAGSLAASDPADAGAPLRQGLRPAPGSAR